MVRMLRLEVKSNGRVAVSIETDRPELILEFLESFYLEPWWDSIELRQGYGKFFLPEPVVVAPNRFLDPLTRPDTTPRA